MGAAELSDRNHNAALKAAQMSPCGHFKMGPSLKALSITLTAIFVLSSSANNNNKHENNRYSPLALFTFVNCDLQISKSFKLKLANISETVEQQYQHNHQKQRQASVAAPALTLAPWVRSSTSRKQLSRAQNLESVTAANAKANKPDISQLSQGALSKGSPDQQAQLEIGLSSSSVIRRERRWAKSRVPLAQRPPKSTTTTTSTTTIPTTSATSQPEIESTTENSNPVKSGDEEEEESAESGDSDDYVDIARPKPTSTTAKPSSTRSESSGGGEEEVGSEEDAGEEEEEQSTTTTTSTTRRPSARKPTSGKPIRGGPRGKSTETTETSRPGGRAKSKAAKKKTASETAPAPLMGVDDSGEKMKLAETSAKKSSDKQIVNGSASEDEQQMQRPSGYQHHLHHHRKKPLVMLPFITPKNTSFCTPEAYLEFPSDFIGDKWRSRGLILIHVLVVCYMFYSLALVCERYFMPSLEEFAQRLQISEDVAGATLMSAGSSAPELFTAILGVFVAKGDVGTGAIVGSAVFNILFVIGLCAFVSTTSAQLQWWPVLRDSVYYTLTVLVLIIIIYDERITAYESAAMILLYGVYITIMAYNEQIKAYVTKCLLANQITSKLISSNSIQVDDGPDDVFAFGSTSSTRHHQSYEMGATSKTVEDDSIYMAALLVILKHKRLFRSTIRFQSAARYITTKRQHRLQQTKVNSQEVNYFGPDEYNNTGRSRKGLGGGDGSCDGSASQRAKMEAYARSATLSKQKFSIVSKDDYEFWHRPPEEGENYYLWLARIPVNYILHYTIPDCSLYPDKYVITFVVSILWTAFFSYIMVWMVSLIGYTLNIPDSVMGVTFLAAGTSVPDCYSSIHAARNGMADMAVSNSIGSNVFDILIGLSVPWFIQSAIYPGIVATINSRGVIYSVILLFLALIVTIYLLNKYEWSLQPRLGLALLIAYGLFIILTCMLEFNLFGHVNPPPCPPPPGAP